MMEMLPCWSKTLCIVRCSDSDAHSTTSSMSPSQSPSYSNQSDDGSDIESKQRRSTSTAFSFLDRSYWKRYILYSSFCGLHWRRSTFQVYEYPFYALASKKIKLGFFSSSFPQAKDLLWHRLQGAVWGGDHRPSVIQALLQLQAAEDAGAHAGGAMPPWHAPPGASRGAEGGLVTLLSFILTPTGLSVAPRFVSSGRLLPHQIHFQCEREVWSTPLAGSLFLFVFALCIELTYFLIMIVSFLYIYRRQKEEKVFFTGISKLHKMTMTGKCFWFMIFFLFFSSNEQTSFL